MVSSNNMSSMPSSDSMPAMPMSMMQMVFFTSTATPLYSMSWAPMDTGHYTGTCVFLILLAAIYRGLIALKQTVEQRWSDRELKRRRVLVMSRSTEADKDSTILGPKTWTMVTERGVEEKVKVDRRYVKAVAPWRYSVDLPRAVLTTVMGGVGYLL